MPIQAKTNDAPRVVRLRRLDLPTGVGLASKANLVKRRTDFGKVMEACPSSTVYGALKVAGECTVQNTNADQVRPLVRHR